MVDFNAALNASLSDYNNALLNAQQPTRQINTNLNLQSLPTNEDVQNWTNYVNSPQFQQSLIQNQQPPTQTGAIGFLNNLGNDIGETVSGLTYAGMHTIKFGQAVGGKLYDFYSGMIGDPWYVRAGKGLAGMASLATDPILSYDNIINLASGKVGLGDTLAQAGKNIYDRPFGSALAALPVATGTVGALKKAGVIKQSAGETVRGMVDTAKKTAGSQAQKVIDSAQEIRKFQKANNLSDADLTTVIRAHGTGADLPAKLKPLARKWGEFSETYDKALAENNKYAQSLTKEDKFRIADTQAKQMTELENGIQRSFQEVEKERIPYHELLNKEEVVTNGIKQTGREALEGLANDGDIIAREVLENAKKFDKGYLRILPEAGIGKEGIALIGEVSNQGRKFAGRASDRAYGTATPQQIAESVIKNTNDWLDAQTAQWVRSNLGRNLAQDGNLVTDTSKMATKDVSYVNRELLETGNLDSALENVIKGDNIPVGTKMEQLVPIDTSTLNVLKDTIKDMARVNSPFGKGIVNDFYQLNKGVSLGTGSYTVGNVTTGAMNMLMNEGINPVSWIKDVGAAIKTQGKLSKELGIYRNLYRHSKHVDNPVIKKIAQMNEPINSTWSFIDTKTQNFFAEVAAHNNLRNKGVAVGERAKYLEDLKGKELVDTINDVKQVALINPSRTIAPHAVNQAFSMVNPFWRWTDTAAQASWHILNKNPLLANYLVVKDLSRIGWDEEMQNRLNLGVKSDKKFVSYRLNPRTNQIMESSMEFMPMMNTLKFLGNASYFVTTGDKEFLKGMSGQAIPFWSAMGNSMFGKDRFGNPIKRADMDRAWYKRNAMTIQNGERMKYNPQTNKFEPVGTQWDEVINTALSNLSSYPNFINRTAAPIADKLMGDNVQYFSPYGNALFGQFGQGSPDNAASNSAFSGNPMKPASLAPWTGIYEMPYYPESEINRNKRDFRAATKRLTRRLGNQGEMRRSLQNYGGNR